MKKIFNYLIYGIIFVFFANNALAEKGRGELI